MKKTRVIILFGGRSAEHEVSLLSARNVLLALDRERFEPLLVGIDKQGRWRIEPDKTLLDATGDPRLLALQASGRDLAVPVHPQPSDLGTSDDARPLLGRDDVVFPVLHGTYGEDGTVQGLLELADIAYVGSGHLGSAIGMDKDVAKRLLAQAGIPVVPWRLITAAAMKRDPERCLALAAELGFPCFVKPANAGSSVGVNKAKSAAALGPAVRAALAFDTKVLVEAGIEAREIECAVLGNDEPDASMPGEIVVHHKDGFYSYDAKYVDADGAEAKIPADLPAETTARVRRLAVDTFRALELSGMARVDFFLDRKSAALYVNEVNTIPGFTAISMYPKMWEASGVPGKELVSRLLDLAVERRAARRGLKTQV
ncbi:MAG: D-alanine--D-alanine ligase [Deltaproteobacteria bacterium]|nr:D-alanine--D-alanine ligase [Deltaproteobacteria bacterium]